MSQRVATPYPWTALERVSRVAAGRARAARRAVSRVLDPRRLAAALGELTECEVQLIVQRVSSEPPRRRPLTGLGLELGDGLLVALAIEPELAVNALGRVLRRPIALSAHGALDDALAGALNAVALEVARRAGARAPLFVVHSSDAWTHANEVFVEGTVLLGGTPYQWVAALRIPELTPSEPASLAALGELPIALPLVVGLGLAERTQLADFQPGNAWFPGAGLWLASNGSGRGALAASNQDHGLSVELSPDGRIVLRGESVQLFVEAGELMTDSAKPEASLADAVLDSPVVVRVEIGAVSMTAREWAELSPGDVIEAGRRIAEPVVLRIAGREVARGELVSLEGELGIRIRELVR